MPVYEFLVVVIVILGDFYGFTASFPQATSKAIGGGGTEDWQWTRDARLCDWTNYVLTIRCYMQYHFS